MLQLNHIKKEYKTGDLVQKALDDVSLNLRDNEFVAILGPSGSGKTTLLNVIGGLDRYDSGDLIINGISTKKYTDRDWDSYRNHTIGFVFQSYNLIPHQTVLSNVELALTISGISGAERRSRATKALEQVGLGDQLHKHPSEMSGGQMQRVAIARALVNNPDILLADEPTGALDSDTSIQVMELLKEVAKDRLVVMVTHNPELAEQYATRIVRLRDGVIQSDTAPFAPDDSAQVPPVHKNLGHSSMSPLTALALSFNNLLTKKTRTLLTAFAGSIGIIGIALILSLSAGVSNYIQEMERSTLSEYPLQISTTGVDLAALLDPGSYTNAVANNTNVGATSASSTPEGMVTVRELLSQLTEDNSSVNDLASLKKYLDSDECTISEDAASIEYSYGIAPLIYRQNKDGTVRQIFPDSSLSALNNTTSAAGIVSSMTNQSVFTEMAEEPSLYEDQYDVKAGRWPESYNEAVLVLNSDGSISDYALYILGIEDDSVMMRFLQEYAKNKNTQAPTGYGTYPYDTFVGLKYKIVTSSDYYVYDEERQIWRNRSDDEAYVEQLVENSPDLTIVGVVQPRADASSTILPIGVAYTHALTYYAIDHAAESEVVKQQLADPEVNVLTGERFDADQREPDLDISSLFSVDTDMLKDAFQFDASKLQFDLSGAFDLQDGSFDFSSILDPSAFQLDLSDLDLSDIDMSDVELPDMDALDLSQLFADMDLSVSEDALQSLMKKIMNGYKRYIIGNGILNLDKIGFSSYMESDQFKQLLSESMGDLLDTTGLQEQFTASLQQNLQGIMTNYLQSYSEQLSQKLGEALQTKLTAAIQTQMSTVMQQLMTQLTTQFSQQIQSAIQNNIAQLSSQVEDALKIDPTVFQSAVQVNMSTDDLVDLVKMNLQSSTTSYSSVLGALGYSDYAKPGSIWIYPKSFEAKNRIVDSLNAYNAAMRAQGEEDKVIVFSDTVGTLMSAVTKIVDMVSNVLVAFVAISLAVSSIMIGVITYISVLERRKEIGILRAIGASKHNVSEVFNAETFIIGMCSGVIGVGLCLLLLIPGNMLIHSIAGTTSVTAVLPPKAALVLIVLATLLTILGGLIPARSAAKCNPVTALRSE
ncbi:MULTISPECIES: ABC transporter ATP-binding protein/permease [Faecalibacterium]|jgi:ABC-type lipoprotein export system ATPase subunit/ABC-type antimicrobial peptide transport system permease subunit|uniref:ABC transporter n=2 Tax=Bacteria TaxID=2 RepID=A0A2J4JQU2_9FIRM|nr:MULTISPECIES: ABC transporter ATP-binding protein/permease [Faecalibacterium]PLK30226.1 ABC transporter [Faecalibacterium prausnitzii]RJV79364.1 ATP-binding cassette domain-containing protein [Faecalibacterium sp. AF27-11BH]